MSAAVPGSGSSQIRCFGVRGQNGIARAPAQGSVPALPSSPLRGYPEKSEDEKQMLAKKPEQKAKGEVIPTTAKVSAGGAGLAELLVRDQAPPPTSQGCQRLGASLRLDSSGPESLLAIASSGDGGFLGPGRTCCLVKQVHCWGCFSSDSFP